MLSDTWAIDLLVGLRVSNFSKPVIGRGAEVPRHPTPRVQHKCLSSYHEEMNVSPET